MSGETKAEAIAKFWRDLEDPQRVAMAFEELLGKRPEDCGKLCAAIIDYMTGPKPGWLKDPPDWLVIRRDNPTTSWNIIEYFLYRHGLHGKTSAPLPWVRLIDGIAETHRNAKREANAKSEDARDVSTLEKETRN